MGSLKVRAETDKQSRDIYNKAVRAKQTGNAALLVNTLEMATGIGGTTLWRHNVTKSILAESKAKRVGEFWWRDSPPALLSRDNKSLLAFAGERYGVDSIV